MAKRQDKQFGKNFTINRAVRTVASEMYYIFRDVEGSELPIRIGKFDLHIENKIYYGTLSLEVKLRNNDFEKLLDQIEGQLIDYLGSREDFILDVYQAKEIGSYSDTISEEQRRYEAPTRADLEDISETLVKVLGKHQDARGKLNEHALVAYFQSLGYKAELAEPDLDHQKIDVVATKESEIIYAQAKLGSVSRNEMRALARSVAAICTNPSNSRMAAITAHSFPPDSDFIRVQLERETGIPLLCIQQYQVLQAAPEYRRMLRSQ